MGKRHPHLRPEKALEAYWHEASNKGPWGPANGREGWKDYYQLGYVSFPGPYGAVSETLEYAYDDFCAYNLAKMTNQPFYEQLFARQMYNYRNVYDSVSGFMRPRKADGSWYGPFDPFEWGGPYVEGNAWHWLWSVFHDTRGLVDLVGEKNVSPPASTRCSHFPIL
nr:glycoside hydrolase domain-containing protein [Chitinophaga sedimenti]